MYPGAGVKEVAGRARMAARSSNLRVETLVIEDEPDDRRRGQPTRRRSGEFSRLTGRDRTDRRDHAGTLSGCVLKTVRAKKSACRLLTAGASTSPLSSVFLPGDPQ